MKTKRKEKGKKKEKKRKEVKRKMYCPNSNSGPLARGATALPLGHVEHTCTQLSSWNFYYQNLRALLDMNSKIFFRRTRRL